ncbi:hypothetical protein H6G20_18140 [Desertifilum sp. FACHB-1129]|uniref:hypothetical protein n=1 Tax=Desertifilum TaxID=1185872 RepID=UPI0013016A9E|nr:MULTISPECIES: hypothetical protein [Desertifilum]MBD2313593.1 hypothetical protein [Desertifilum sp. FACHB-1129]MBD2320586.1 hypothetical protein [Desertifilum sp. FACHB-866]MBD2330714.1 hypothetical protein [Desertifilum sp. FACHB-868]MDA0210181.1 hypothetical protein [Cyanobacteria bacterium FC1]
MRFFLIRFLPYTMLLETLGFWKSINFFQIKASGRYSEVLPSDVILMLAKVLSVGQVH